MILLVGSAVLNWRQICSTMSLGMLIISVTLSSTSYDNVIGAIAYFHSGVRHFVGLAAGSALGYFVRSKLLVSKMNPLPYEEQSSCSQDLAGEP